MFSRPHKGAPIVAPIEQLMLIWFYFMELSLDTWKNMNEKN